VVGASARQGCVHISLTLAGAMQQQQQQQEGPCSPAAPGGEHAAQQLGAAIQAKVLQALGLAAEGAAVQVHVQGAAAGGPSVASVQPVVLCIEPGAREAPLAVELHHAQGCIIAAYTEETAHDAQPPQQLVLAVRCGPGYLPARITRTEGTAGGSCVVLAVSLPAALRASQLLAVEAWQGLDCASEQAVYVAVPQPLGSSHQPLPIAADLRRLAVAAGTDSLQAFLSDWCLLQDMLDVAQCGASQGTTAAAADSGTGEAAEGGAQGLAPHLVQQLSVFACSRGLLALASHLVQLQDSSPAGRAAFGEVHWLAAVPGAAAALAGAARDSGSELMVQRVAAWAAEHGAGVSPAQGGSSAGTAAAAPRAAARRLAMWASAGVRRWLLGAARLRDATRCNGCSSTTTTSSSKAGTSGCTMQSWPLQSAAQAELGKGWPGLARSVVLGFRDPRLRAAYARQQAAAGSRVTWLIMAAMRLGVTIQVLGLVVGQLGLRTALPLVLLVCSLMASGVAAGITGKARQSMALVEASAILLQLAFTAVNAPVALGWVAVESQAWRAWAARATIKTGTARLFTHPILVGLVVSLNDRASD
jgi:hypothetical protein